MSIVSSTAVFTIKPVDLKVLKTSPYLHQKVKKEKRVRQRQAFHHVIIKRPEKKAVYLVYGNGKCVVLGVRIMSELNEAASWLASAISSTVVERCALRNLVYVFNATFPELQQNMVLIRLRERLLHDYPHVSYEPELSPGLMINPNSYPSAKVMIFRSGKICMTGIRSKGGIDVILRELEKSAIKRAD